MSTTMRPKIGLCQECKQIKALAIDHTRIVEGRPVQTRICWICMRKLITPPAER